MYGRSELLSQRLLSYRDSKCGGLAGQLVEYPVYSQAEGGRRETETA